ncbi:hypothetical protein C8J56DRAFT_1161807 [Mycena floridula]|nr:hypothetical protein C8J56DRAFT_1161807 [Mycena floridula]
MQLNMTLLDWRSAEALDGKCGLSQCYASCKWIDMEVQTACLDGFELTYSKIMLWVAIDRGLRIASKRSLPCPNYTRWLEARDEEIMHKSYSKTPGQFGQSYEEPDSTVLVTCRLSFSCKGLIFDSRIH